MDPRYTEGPARPARGGFPFIGHRTQLTVFTQERALEFYPGDMRRQRHYIARFRVAFLAGKWGVSEDAVDLLLSKENQLKPLPSKLGPESPRSAPAFSEGIE